MFYKLLKTLKKFQLFFNKLPKNYKKKELELNQNKLNQEFSIDLSKNYNLKKTDFDDLCSKLLKFSNCQLDQNQEIQKIKLLFLIIEYSKSKKEQKNFNTVQSIKAINDPNINTSYEFINNTQQIKDLNTQLSSKQDSYVFFLNAGDCLNSNFTKVFQNIAKEPKQYGICDGYKIISNNVHLILKPGINQTLSRYDKNYYSGLFILQKQLYEITKTLVDTSLQNVILDLLTQIERRSKEKYFKHIKFPLINYTHEQHDENHVISLQGDNKNYNNSVTVVICSKNKGHLLKNLVEKISMNKLIKEVVIVSNNTDAKHALVNFNELNKNKKVKIIKWNGKFNFSFQSNLGGLNAQTEYSLFLNDDIIPISDNWLDLLINQLDKNDVAAVGPLLLYPDETIQHGGMYLGFNNVCGHQFRFAGVNEVKDHFMLKFPRECSAVTGAVLLTKTDLFKKMNGFDTRLGSYLQDLDLCLRFQEIGQKVILEPNSILFHFESVSVKESFLNNNLINIREIEYHIFSKKWPNLLSLEQYEHPFYTIADESKRKIKIDISKL